MSKRIIEKHKCYLYIIAMSFTKLLFLLVASIGTEATNKITIEQFPYIVSVRYNDQHICGGAILDKTTVLTSAQCIYDMKPKPKLISIRTGSSEHSKGVSVQGSGSPFNPPDYLRDYHENDLGIIKLATNLEFDEKVQPIQLPDKDYVVPDDTVASFVGWGVNGAEIKEVSDSLRHITMSMLSYMKCTEKYGMNMIHPSTMLCAESTSQQFCRGDLGGPLVINNTLVGVASWIYNCNESTHPGVFTNVAKFREWIDEHVE